jgi:cation:H+ antiporter
VVSSPWPLLPSLGVLAAMAVVIVLAGVRLTRVADSLAERTGLGDALGGALLLGALTSLPGNVTVLTGALEGNAGFALANPIGGIALQTVWLAIADLVYRRANLEHAAASLQNVLQSVVLIAMLAVPVLAYATPTLSIGWIHPPDAAHPGPLRLRSGPAPPDAARPDVAADPDLADCGRRRGGGPGRWQPRGRDVHRQAVGHPGRARPAGRGGRMGQLTLGAGNIGGGNVYDTLMIAPAHDRHAQRRPEAAACGVTR